ncbi:ATPase family associated with various cellular activities (AAA) [Botrimarina colliarenosi]|uniref:ATPase family associated with various cellular activities (AAA) n=1 Tax=Botrimarina colliarenosi TaxID=2528001 RepID=A0A5C6A7W2_9BACT|nr:MoxR family ATPase [Botrimarina colliarenosi]TWT96102.1 ATPase family associated with various cellular activities (AAA) [Botrimarina colliarenosi]
MTHEETPPPDAERLCATATRIREQLARVIVGQDGVIDLLMIALFCRGHCLLEGAPGLAKTLLISTLAKTLGLTFSRIQFTPDLMPADILGTEIIEEDRATGRRDLRFLAGPIFSHVILADEINRTPPKTQAALLEAMQERQVTVGRVRREIGHPFFVLATQNPIEQEGTYPLPEAQQDRFMFKAIVRYPTFAEEIEVAQRTTAGETAEVEAVSDVEEMIALQKLVRTTPVGDDLVRYAVALVRGSRVGEPDAAPEAATRLAWGAGPRAVQFLILGAKARALMAGRPCVAIEDLQTLAKPVLRHRLLLNFQTESEGLTADDVIDGLLTATPTRDESLRDDPRFRGVLAG